MEQVVGLVIKGDASSAVNASKAAQSAVGDVGKAAAAAAPPTATLTKATNDFAAAQAAAKREIDEARASLKSGSLSQEEYNRTVLASRASISGVAGAYRQSVAELNAASAAQRQAAAAATGLNQANGQTRAGFTQLGFQINDVTTQMASGTKGSIIFAQQSGQILAALQLLGGGMDNTSSKMGKFLGFLGGPWGIGITIAVSVLGAFSGKLFETAEGSDSASKSTLTLVDALSKQNFGTTAATKAINEYVDAQAASRSAVEKNITLSLRSANARLTETIKIREQIKAEFELQTAFAARSTRGAGGGTDPIISARREFSAALAQNQTALDQAKKAVNELTISDAKLAAAAAVDPIKAINRQYDDMAAAAERAAAGNEKLAGSLKKTLTGIERRRKSDIGEAAESRKTTRAPKARAADTNFSASEIGGQNLLNSARQYLGRSENNSQDNDVLQKLFSQANINIDPDKVAWCAAFVNSVLAVNGLPGNGKLNARSFLTYGNEAADPKKGDIAVFRDLDGNNQAQGHVGFFQGYDKNGNIKILGGNQGRDGAVTETTINKDKLLGFRRAPTASQAADQVETDFKQLEEFGKRASAAIGSINARYNEQPRLIAEAASVTGELDAVIKELSERQPIGFEGAIEEAKRLKEALPAQILAEPFVRMNEEAARQAHIQGLILAGREDEVRVLERIADVEAEIGPISEARKADISDIVANEERINDLLNKREVILGAYSASIGDLRSGLNELLSGGNIKDFAKGLKQNIRRLQGNLLTEQLFGQPLRDLEKLTQKRTGVDAQIDVFKAQIGDTATNTRTLADNIAANGKKVTDALSNLATNLAGNIGDAGAPGTVPNITGSLGSGDVLARIAANQPGIVADEFAQALSEALGRAPENADIVVQGQAGRTGDNSINSLTPEAYFGEIGAVLTEPLLKKLDGVLGTSFFSKLSLVFRGVAEGYAQAGEVGAVIGGAQGFARQLVGRGVIGNETFAAVNEALGTAAAGARTGFQVAQIGRAVGINTSSTGGAIGGAAGAFLPIPGGQIIGSIVGSIVGGLFKKKPRGSAIITNAEDPAQINGNKDAVREGLGTISGGIQEQIQQIASVLGGEIGAFRVSVGQYKDTYRVSASGSANVGDKKFARGAGSDLIYEGKDANAAAAAALRNAIADGGVSGISEAMQRALASDTNLDRALREALKVRDVEDILGGIGGALTKQFAAFEAQAKERVRIAGQYGFDVIKIEEYNTAERIKIVDRVLTERVGSLQNLLTDLRSGSLFEGTAAEQRLALIADIDKAKEEAAAGTAGAADRVADLSRQLIETSRDAYGTAGTEYAADRANAISSAETIIAAENERIRAAQQATLDTAAATIDTARLTNEANNLLTEINAGIADMRGLLSGSNGVAAAAAGAASASSAASLRQSIFGERSVNL